MWFTLLYFAIFSLKFHMKINIFIKILLIFSLWLRLNILHDYSIKLCICKRMSFECLIKRSWLAWAAMKADFYSLVVCMIVRCDYEEREERKEMLFSSKHGATIFLIPQRASACSNWRMGFASISNLMVESYSNLCFVERG